MHGIDVWFDKWEILAGESLTDKLSVGLIETNAFIILMSPNSMSSKWVKEELRVALQRRIRDEDFKIIPILLEECTIPAFLLDYIYIDWRKEELEGFESLLRALKQTTLKPAFTKDQETPKCKFIHTSLRIDITGERGHLAHFDDSFKGEAILAFTELSRMLYFSGEMSNVRINADLNIDRQNFTPQAERWTVRFPTQILPGDRFYVRHLFDITNCFDEDNPYWTFAVDSPEDRLSFSLNYSLSTPIHDFTVLHRVGHSLYPEPILPSHDPSSKEYSWEKLFPTHKDTYEFHWKWNEH